MHEEKIIATLFCAMLSNSAMSDGIDVVAVVAGLAGVAAAIVLSLGEEGLLAGQAWSDFRIAARFRGRCTPMPAQPDAGRLDRDAVLVPAIHVRGNFTCRKSLSPEPGKEVDFVGRLRTGALFRARPFAGVVAQHWSP